MPPIRRKPSLPPVPIRRLPTAVVHQPIASTPTMGSMVKSGFSWGLGNGIANTLVGSMFNKVSTVPSSVPPSVPPSVPSPSNEYIQCMKDFDDKEACKHLLK